MSKIPFNINVTSYIDGKSCITIILVNGKPLPLMHAPAKTPCQECKYSYTCSKNNCNYRHDTPCAHKEPCRAINMVHHQQRHHMVNNLFDQSLLTGWETIQFPVEYQ